MRNYGILVILGLVLMAAYAGVIARALGFEHPVDCSCFGKLGTGRVTPRVTCQSSPNQPMIRPTKTGS